MRKQKILLILMFMVFISFPLSHVQAMNFSVFQSIILPKEIEPMYLAQSKVRAIHMWHAEIKDGHLSSWKPIGKGNPEGSTYDTKGNKVGYWYYEGNKWISYWPWGLVREIKIYDDNNNLIEHQIYSDKSNEMTGKFIFEYQQDSIEMTRIFSSSGVTGRSILDVSGGLIIHEESYNAKGINCASVDIEYYPSGIVSKITVNSINEEPWNGVYITKYDQHGNPIESIRYTQDNKLSARSQSNYEYDSRGNWIMRKDYKYDPRTDTMQQTRATKRIVEYYDLPVSK